MVQCLLVIWFAFLTAQAHSMELQARMFEYVYETTIEKAQSERKKKKNVIRIEGKLLFPKQGARSLYVADKQESHHPKAQTHRSRELSRKISLPMKTSHSISEHPRLRFRRPSKTRCHSRQTSRHPRLGSLCPPAVRFCTNNSRLSSIPRPPRPLSRVPLCPRPW